MTLPFFCPERAEQQIIHFGVCTMGIDFTQEGFYFNEKVLKWTVEKSIAPDFRDV